MSTTHDSGKTVPDSTDSQPNRFVSPEECAAWRELVRRGEQSRRDIARGVEWSRTTVIKHVGGHEDCPHDDDPAPVRQPGGGTGVHDADSAVVAQVADVLDERLERNYGDTVSVDAGALASECEAQAGQYVTAALRKLAADGSEHGLVVERVNPGANQPHWAARRAGGAD